MISDERSYNAEQKVPLSETHLNQKSFVEFKPGAKCSEIIESEPDTGHTLAY